MCLHVHVRGRLFYIEVVGLFCRKMFSQMHVHSFLQCMQLATCMQEQSQNKPMTFAKNILCCYTVATCSTKTRMLNPRELGSAFIQVFLSLKGGVNVQKRRGSLHVNHMVPNYRSPSIDSLHLLRGGIVEQAKAVSPNPRAARLGDVQCGCHGDGRICRVPPSL